MYNFIDDQSSNSYFLPMLACMCACVWVCLPQWQRGQQSWVSQRSSLPSGQLVVSILPQLTFVVEINTWSFTFLHSFSTHLSCADSHFSPTYIQRKWSKPIKIFCVIFGGHQILLGRKTRKHSFIKYLNNLHTLLSFPPMTVSPRIAPSVSMQLVGVQSPQQLPFLSVYVDPWNLLNIFRKHSITVHIFHI